MKRKRLILTILSLVVLLSLSSSVLWCCLSGKYVETAESIRDYFMWPTYQRLPLEYYNSFGYYPRSMDEAVDFYQQTYWPNMAKKDLRAQQFLTDPFARDGGEFLYIPLYDYYKKVPVSFILLSAGVDGKMDNKITPSDTLYLNNWWAKLDVYNYEEAILLQDFCERWDETSNVFGEVEPLDYYPPYPDIPRFRMTDYLWGKKDWIVQLGPLTGLY